MIVIKCDPAARYGTRKPEDVHPASQMFYPQEDLVTLAEIGRRLWVKLFTSVSSEIELSEWEHEIPNYGCQCKGFYFGWKQHNQPTFPLPFRWKYDLKTAVNAKLGHPNITYDQAFAEWYGRTLGKWIKKESQ